MANEKILNTRVQLKYDTLENWLKTDKEKQGANLVLKQGEIGICAIPAGAEVEGVKNPPRTMLKVGDGTTPFGQLSWLSGYAADVENWAKAETKPTYSANEITGIGEYIAQYVDEELGISVDTNTVYQIVKIDNNHYKLQSKAAGTDAWADVAGSEIVIPESTKVEDSDKNGYIKVDGAEVQVFDEVFGVDMATVNALGGIAAGTNLKDKTLHEVLNALLFPYVKPTVGTPSRVPNTTSALEKGNNQTITQVSATVTKKSAAITKVELLKGSEVIATKEGSDLPNITTSGTSVVFSGLNISVPSSSVTLKVRVTDAEGSTVTSGETAGWTFVYPYFYGVCAGNKTAATLTEADIEAMTKDIKSKGEKTYTYTTDNQKMVIAYPKAYGVLKKALDPNGFDYLSDYDRAELSITGLDGNAQTYYVYAQKAPSFVTSFAMKFQY